MSAGSSHVQWQLAAGTGVVCAAILRAFERVGAGSKQHADHRFIAESRRIMQRSEPRGRDVIDGRRIAVAAHGMQHTMGKVSQAVPSAKRQRWLFVNPRC